MSNDEFTLDYLNRAGTEWEPMSKKSRTEKQLSLPASWSQPAKPVSATSLSAEEFAAYKASGAYSSKAPWNDDEFDSGAGAKFTASKSKTASATSYVRCYESHPPLKLGDGLVIYGGSCSFPVVKDADIYIALDSNYSNTQRHWPWKENSCLEIRYPITDMDVPSSSESFVQMIAWLAQQIQAGKKTHVGCIGGHGRTGTVLSALYAHMNPDDKDAIQYVRANYCKKAVESQKQVNFLMKHFGVTKVDATKTWSTGGSSKSVYSSYAASGTPAVSVKATGARFATPIQSERCIWGKIQVNK